ncbi:MAG: hypothetical protein HRF40_11895 [Nitrososphaera sp.]|jgi:hypothetical protein
MDNIRFSIKNGSWELSYEGSEDFLRTEFRAILENLLESPMWEAPSFFSESADDPPNNNVMGSRERGIPSMTMNNLCAMLNCQTGVDLVLAACVHLTFMKAQDQLARSDILQTMKDATRYYKETFRSNLSNYLQSLVTQGKLMESKDDIYVLTPACVSEMEGTLARS